VIANILAALVGVSILYYALVFYGMLFRKLIGGAIRSGEPSRLGVPRNVNLWLVVLSLALLMASGWWQYQRTEDIRRTAQSARE
jgi:hypothetical protein